ncbi:hydroxymethylglutaryl-CoA lyase [Pseudonocardia halophobica]|uniref:Hydroxymethylglutaryl-CoA lyase n=1 Tax=Pseudonocardia halophobica TaxID=29401 RepID=A0A9W6P111_9PSEU|nr:hydroxymethylglutaryl-CoA lyase [Pseudonocardia halophobica]GLL15826.1 hydroxymethylglutaryl-CoA lyase [Pseudonocardia halophobica]
MTGALGLPRSIRLREVSLRDGLQIEAPMPTSAKLELLDALVAAGLRRIEATAFVSPSAVPALADAAEVAAHLSEYQGVEFSALVASPGGARRAVDAGVTSLEYVVSASDGHSRANAGRASAEALARVADVAGIVNRAGGRTEVIVAVAWDCPFDGPTPPEAVVSLARRAVESGAERLCLGDTIGTVTPGRMADLVAAVRQACPTTPLGVHLHDTRGMGMATALAAMQLGVLDLDASIGGLGGCPFAPGASGNIATEELAYLCREVGVETGTDLAALLEAVALAERIVGRPLESRLLRAGDRRRD